MRGDRDRKGARPSTRLPGGRDDPKPSDSQQKEEPVRRELRAAKIKIRDADRDKILDLVVSARIERGECVPDGRKKGSKAKSAAEGCGDDTEAASERSARTRMKERERVKRRLLRQLLSETKEDAIADARKDAIERRAVRARKEAADKESAVNGAVASESSIAECVGGLGGNDGRDTKKAAVSKIDSRTVRIQIVNASKPKSSKMIVVPRDSTTVAELVSQAVAKLGCKKKAGKQPLWCHLQKDPDKFPLLDLLLVENDEAIFFTTEPPPGPPASSSTAGVDTDNDKNDTNDHPKDMKGGAKDDTEAGGEPAEEEDTTALTEDEVLLQQERVLRGAYAARHARRSGFLAPLAPAEVEEQSRRLLERQQAGSPSMQQTGSTPEGGRGCTAEGAASAGGATVGERSREAMAEQRSRLPAFAKRAEIIQAVQGSPVVIIGGATGSGKTTQVAQYLLEDAVARGAGGGVGIVCTQPRRIAAVSVAERVAAERGEAVGDAVGYAAGNLAGGVNGGGVGAAVRQAVWRVEVTEAAQGGGRYCAKKTRVMFCTTGVLLRRFLADPDLAGVTHLILDEVHERSLHTDFLLTLLKQVLQRAAGSRGSGGPSGAPGGLRQEGLKVVLMSATVDAQLFRDYFQLASGSGSPEHSPVPVIQIEGRTFPVAVRWLDEAEYFVKTGRVAVDQEIAAHGASSARRDEDDAASGMENEGPGPERDADIDERLARTYGKSKTEVLSAPEVDPKAAIDFAFIAQLILRIASSPADPALGGTQQGRGILVFLPGTAEIDKLARLLRGSEPGKALDVLPLHGQLNVRQQRAVFETRGLHDGRPERGRRAAWEAEGTAPQPPARTRVRVVLATNIAETSLTVPGITDVIDMGQQREMRFHPVSSLQALTPVWVAHTNACQRAGRAGRICPGVCWRLFSKRFYEGKLPKQALCEMRRTPLEELVLFLAMEVLLGTSGSKRLLLTPLGFHLAHLPVDPHIGKLLLYGAILKCSSQTLTMAACLSAKSPFVRPFNASRGLEDEIRQRRETDFGPGQGNFSDHLAMCMVYSRWLGLGDHRERQEFVAWYSLSESALRMIQELRDSFATHLEAIGFPQDDSLRGSAGMDKREQPMSEDSRWMAKCSLIAALYPHVSQLQKDLATVKGGSAKGGSKGAGFHSKVKYSLVPIDSLEPCLVHPSSVNFNKLSHMRANDGWLLYHKRMKTSATFMFDTTLIGSMPLLLFGGSAAPKLSLVGKTSAVDRTLVLDGRLSFQCVCPQTAVLIKILRQELDSLFVTKVLEPEGTGVTSKCGDLLVAAMCGLLQAEGGADEGQSSKYEGSRAKKS
ncbi:hypothetical protein CYMTET_24741 [Cymbomonas tetramitiformis]|uniref:Uncharacterized protein n=1 Tax=Cymbomonas tetramitiformis TaxID=36881 RepID=A0AAE0FV55_9CHLO|nr:hypothetical protein CYMTET_24741 [Cymbomonas tetramitiformis]